MAFGLRYVTVARRIASDPLVARALDDERVRRSRTLAHVAGFWCLGAYLVAMRLLALAIPLSGSVVAQAGIGVAMGSSIVAFIIYERD